MKAQTLITTATAILILGLAASPTAAASDAACEHNRFPEIVNVPYGTYLETHTDVSVNQLAQTPHDVYDHYCSPDRWTTSYRA